MAGTKPNDTVYHAPYNYTYTPLTRRNNMVKITIIKSWPPNNANGPKSCYKCGEPFQKHQRVISKRAGRCHLGMTAARLHRYCTDCAIFLHIYIPELDDA